MNELDRLKPKLMTKEGDYLQFDGPTGWTEFHDGPRMVFQGKNREELTVSGTVISGDGDAAELKRIQQSALQGAIALAKRSASHPDLKVTQPLCSDSRVAGLECWTILAETQQGDAVFYQSVIGHIRGVVYVTFEAPKSNDTEQVFDRFLRSIRNK